MSITRLNISQTEYRSIHQWIQDNYGKATSCVSADCSNKSKSFSWALVKGKSHERNIENYISLCASCHLLYDYDDERKEKMRKSMMGKNSVLFKKQISIVKHSYRFGSTIADLAKAFSVSEGAIFRHTKTVCPIWKKDKKPHTREPQLRKYNPTQINVMKSARSFGVSYSDLARVFNGNDKDRANIYRIVNDLAYV